ncbi:MAG: carbon-nitrogen hydrolase family protein [Oscillospiraceae bacterium]|nr:carbon-nitrogen hydrolase family protein [Oscillospiraceae bacterium]
MNLFKVALLQIAPCGNLNDNLKKGIEFCRKAKEKGSDIALFPEMFSCGYDIYNRPFEVWEKDAIPKDDEFVKAFSKLAAELDMAIGITFLEKHSPLPRNTLTLFDRHGKEVFTYAKIHTCDFGVENNLSPGDDFYVGDLDTKSGVVKVGAMICYDREFPESARILMLKGAEIILVPNACPMEINRLSQLRGRAYENMTGIATCNYPEPVPDCNGHSSAFDGVAYLPELSCSRDTCIMEADGSEGIFLAEFDMDMIRDYRNREVHGNAYRKVSKYTLITENTVNAPFIRANRRKEI